MKTHFMDFPSYTLLIHFCAEIMSHLQYTHLRGDGGGHTGLLILQYAVLSQEISFPRHMEEPRITDLGPISQRET